MVSKTQAGCARPDEIDWARVRRRSKAGLEHAYIMAKPVVNLRQSSRHLLEHRLSQRSHRRTERILAKRRVHSNSSFRDGGVSPGRTLVA